MSAARGAAEAPGTAETKGEGTEARGRFGNGNVTEHGAERGDFLVRLYFLTSVTKCRKVPFISLRYEIVTWDTGMVSPF